MSPRQPRLQKITVSLLKEGLELSSALREKDGLATYRVPSIDRSQDALHVLAKPPTPPRWATYLSPHVSGDIKGILTASAAAVLLFESADRLFAVTFGQGRHLLASDAFVHDFGLRVVLNTVAPDQLKSVDAKTIDETTMHTRRDLSRDSSFAAFGLDVSRDVLRAVTGTPEDPTLAHRLTGADALGIQTRLQVPDLPDLAKRLLEAYEAEKYKEHFDFIDFLRPVKEPDKVSELDSKLIKDLRSGELDDVHLAAPETLDWIDLEGFVFSSHDDADTANDPRISEYLQAFEAAELDVAHLKADRLAALRASDSQEHASWRIYDCLVYQVELGGDLFVLSTGDWFCVDLDYRDRVEADVNALPRLEGLPDADVNTNEGAYNVKAAQHLDALCLDQKLVYDSGPDKMEICDILTRGGGLIHVKQRGSSSTLSHLFTQGVNSGERLLLDQDFRDRARVVAASENADFSEALPAGRPSPSDHEISFVVITRSTRSTPLTLPFFSVVSLRAAASRLQAFGFKVSVAAVQEER